MSKSEIPVNMVIAFVASTIFAFLSRSFRRQKLTYIFSITAVRLKVE